MSDPIGLLELLDRGGGIITRRDALGHLSAEQLRHRLGRSWQIVLPGVYAAFTGALTDRQRLQAGLMFAGPTALLSDLSMLGRCNLRCVPATDQVFVLIDQAQGSRGRDWLRIRRTHRLPKPVFFGSLPCVPAERAWVELVLRGVSNDVATAVLCESVQRRVIRLGALREELRHLPLMGGNRVRLAAAPVLDGARSAPESDYAALSRSSKILPRPLLNCLLQLPSGLLISPDALYNEAGLVHETNGRSVHAGEDSFESMQSRHDAMTAAGLTVLHNSPRRLRVAGATVIREVEQCFLRDQGRGLPPGVIIRREGPPMNH
jgi:hypothetical protein